MRVFRFGLFVVIGIFLIGCVRAGIASRAADNDLKAAADKAVITPPIGIPMGGYFAYERKAEGTHDQLYARCLVLKIGKQVPVAFISLDLIGFLSYDVDIVRKRFGGNITLFVFSTHQHSGPDTIGVFGEGRDERYMSELRSKIIFLIQSTLTILEPASLSFWKSDGVGLAKNWKDPEIVDNDINVLMVSGKKGIIGTLVNFGCHPEALGKKNRLITADFPGYLVNKIEKECGGTALFANGLLGGMVSIATENFQNKEKSFELAKKVGEKLASRVLSNIRNYTKLEPKNFYVSNSEVAIPFQNDALRDQVLSGHLPLRSFVTNQHGEITDVNVTVSVLRLGQLEILMIPGEMTPVLGLKLKTAPMTMIIGLANDEIGYILPEKDYYLPKFQNERSKSLGPKTGTIIYNALKDLSSNR
mgnify:CR=1 FL=1